MVAKELATYDEGEDEDDKSKTLLNLAKGARLGPTNHAGPKSEVEPWLPWRCGKTPVSIKTC